MHHTIVSVAVFLIFGTVVGSKLPYAPYHIFVVALLLWCLAALFQRFRFNTATHWAIVAFIVAIGALRCQTGDVHRHPHSVRQFIGSGRQAVTLLIISPVDKTTHSYSFIAELLSVRIGRQKITNIEGLISVNLNGTPTSGPPVYGTIINTSTIFKDIPHHFTSPWSNLRDQYFAKGIVAKTTIQAFSVKELPPNPPSRVRAMCYTLRKYLAKLISNTHEERTAAILRGLLFGDRNSLPVSIKNDFQRAGTVHLLAQSGLHVGILALVIYAGLTSLRIGKKCTTLATIFVLLLFCIMVGERSSVWRATLMASFILVGKLIERRPSYFASLAAAAIVLIVIHPTSLFLPGFQLSFIATIGILYLSPVLSDLLAFLPAEPAALLSVSLAAFLATSPLTIYHFDGVPIISPLANVFILPLVGIIIPCALIALVGGLFSSWVAFFFGAANYGFITLLIFINSLFASPVFPVLHLETLPIAYIVIWYTILIIIGNPRGSINILAASGTADTASMALLESDGSLADNEQMFRDILVREPEQDLLSQILFDSRKLINERITTLQLHVAEANKRLARILGRQDWEQLNERTRELLLFSETWQTAFSDEFRPALATLLQSVENEFNHSVIHSISRELLRFQQVPQAKELKLLLNTNRASVKLPLISDLLWLLATPDGPKVDPLLTSIKKHISSNMENSFYLLEAPYLPLLLDQLMQKYYWRLPLKNNMRIETFMDAREFVIATEDENIIRKILSCRLPFQQML